MFQIVIQDLMLTNGSKLVLQWKSLEFCVTLAMKEKKKKK